MSLKAVTLPNENKEIGIFTVFGRKAMKSGGALKSKGALNMS